MQEECASDITTASSFSVNEAVSTNAAPDTSEHNVKNTHNISEQLLHSDTEQHTPSQQHIVDSDNVAAIRVLSVTHNHDNYTDKEVTAAHTDAPAIIHSPPTSTTAHSGHHTSSHTSSSPSRRSVSNSEDAYHHDESRRSVKEASVEPRVEMSATPPPPRSSLAQTACYEDTLRSSNSSNNRVENDYVSEVQEGDGVGQRGRRYIPLVSPAIASSPEATPNTASGSPHRPTTTTITTTISKEEDEGCTRALLPNNSDEQKEKSNSSSSRSNTSVYATPHEPTARVLSTEGDDNTLTISQHSVPSLSYEQRTEQLCETEDVMRAVVEYDEHEARQLSMQLHKCTVDALETAQSIALQESTLRVCIEAEARLAGQQLRQRAGEDEVARLRDLVRQRALLIESERHVRRDGVEGEEVKERAELLNLFRVGLAAWLRQGEVRRKRALMQLGTAAESCVFAEMRARAEAAVEESKERALLYEEWVNAEAALLEREKEKQQQLHSEEETKDKKDKLAEKTVLEPEPDDVSEITAIDETSEVLHDAALVVASSDKGSRKSSHEEALEEAPVHESALHTSQVSKEGEEGEQAEDVEYFEWNPTHNSSVPTPPHTTNTNTSTNSTTTMKDVQGGVKMNGQSHESHSPSPSVTQAIPQQTQANTQKEEGEEEETHSHDVVTHDTSTSVEIDERRSRSATVRVTPAKALLTSMSQALRSAGDERSARKAEALLASTTERAEVDSEHHNREEDTQHKEEKEENEEEVCSSTTSTSMAPDEDDMEEEEDMVGEVVEVVPHTPVRENMKYSVNGSARATMAQVMTRHTVPCSLRTAPADSYHAFLNKYGGNSVERPPPTMRRCRSTTSSSSSRARNVSSSREREDHRYCHEDHITATRSSSALRTRNKVLRTTSVDKDADVGCKEERVLLPPRPYRTRIVYADKRSSGDNDTIRDDCVPEAFVATGSALQYRGINDNNRNKITVKPVANPRSEPHYLQPTKAWAVQEREKEIVRALRFCSQHTSPCATPTRTHSARRPHDSGMHSRNITTTREGRTQHRSDALYKGTAFDNNKTRPLLSDDTTCVDTQSVQAADGVAVPDFGRCYDCDEGEYEVDQSNAAFNVLHSCNKSGLISSSGTSKDTVQRKCAPRRRLTTLIPRRDMAGRAMPYSYVNVFLRRYSPESAGRRCVAVGALKGTHADYDALVAAPLNETPLLRQQQLNKESKMSNYASANGALVPRCEATDAVALHDLDVVSNTTADSTSALLPNMPEVEKESIHRGEADKLVEVEEEGECAIASQSSEADELSERDYVPARRTTTDSFKRSVEQPHRQGPQPSPLRRHTQPHTTSATAVKEYRSGNGQNVAASGSGYAARHDRRCNVTPNTLSARQYEGSSSFARSLPHHTPSRLLRFTPT